MNNAGTTGRRKAISHGFPLAMAPRLGQFFGYRLQDRKTQGRSSMLSRRDFAGVASCALCSLTGFIATDASAQTPPPATNGTPGVTRKILSQVDGPTPGYTTLVVDIT